MMHQLIECATPGGKAFLAVDGFPGLTKRPGKTWRIARKGYTLNTGTEVLGVAVQLYVDFEYDPEAVAEKIRGFHRAKVPRVKLSVLLDKWIEHCDLVNREQRKTLAEKESILKAFIGRSGDIPIGAVPLPVLISYVNAVRARTSESHAAKHLHKLRAFWRWAAEVEGQKCDPLPSLVQTPKVPRRGRRLLLEVADVNRVAVELNGPPLLAFVIMYSFGMRAVELRRMKRTDVMLNRRELHIVSAKRNRVGNGQARERTVPFPADPDIGDRLVMWASIMEKPSGHWLNVVFRRACMRAGVEQLTTRSLRRMCITNWLLVGCGRYDVMRWSGHTNIEQTMEYLLEKERATVLPPSTGLVF